MNLLVCVKQVPDLESVFVVNPSGTWYDESCLAFRMNEYDEYAVEQALLLKEQLGGDADITVLSVGPERVVETLRKAMAMGCDRGVHVLDPQSHGRDPWQIASIIAEFAGSRNFDVIFTGMQSQDRGSAQVGVTVAELLGMPSVTTVIGFACDNGMITARRELEGGTRGTVKLPVPALVTCQSGLNVPRYPTLPGILKAKKKELLSFPVSDLLRQEELVETTGIYAPTRTGSGIVLEGNLEEMIERLVGILREKGIAGGMS
jgi:electron transfer flavoprotein beta subunit